MILGFDFYGSINAVTFNTNTALNNFNRLDLSSSVLDELFIDSDITKTFNSEKDEWGYTTILDSKFLGNLSGGSINNEGVPINQIKFRKRKTNTLEWQDIALFNFDTMVKIYTYIDNIVVSNEDYEYCLVPITQGVIGNSLLGTITPSFDGTFVCNAQGSYQLLADLQYSDIEHVFENSVVETFAQYPIILSSPVDYKKSSIKCKVLTDNVIESSSISQEDIKPLKQLKDNMLKFFKSRKPFILKDSTGNYFLVSLMNFKETPDNDLQRKASGISFDWVEIGNSENLTDMRNAGLAL